MKIGLLAHALRGGGGISIGQNLIAALGRIAPEERYLVSIPRGLGYRRVCQGLPRHELARLDGHSWGRRWRFDRRVLPAALDKFQPDVVVGMGSLGFQGKRRFPQALLYHNPYLIYPRRNFGRAVGKKELFEVYLKRKVFARDLQRTGILFTPTTACADRIRGRYGYPGRFIILPNAISRFLRPGEPETSPPAPLRQFGNCLKCFYLTRYYPHKNIEILVELFDRRRREMEGIVLFITVSEDQHPAAGRLLERIRGRNLESMIVNLGPLPQSELSAYYSNMDALLMPSLMEVFSGSYLEAMHYGVPILTSDLDFAREVCGPAALYFDPWETTSIRDAIFRLRDEPGLAGELVRAGKEQAAGRFIGWDEIAGVFLEGLRELAGGGG